MAFDVWTEGSKKSAKNRTACEAGGQSSAVMAGPLASRLDWVEVTGKATVAAKCDAECVVRERVRQSFHSVSDSLKESIQDSSAPASSALPSHLQRKGVPRQSDKTVSLGKGKNRSLGRCEPRSGDRVLAGLV